MNHEKERREAIQSIHEAMEIIMLQISRVDNVEKLYQIRDKCLQSVDVLPDVDNCEKYKNSLKKIKDIVDKSDEDNK